MFYICFSHFGVISYKLHKYQHRKINKQTQNINFITPLCARSLMLWFSLTLDILCAQCTLKQTTHTQIECYAMCLENCLRVGLYHVFNDPLHAMNWMYFLALCDTLFPYCVIWECLYLIRLFSLLLSILFSVHTAHCRIRDINVFSNDCKYQIVPWMHVCGFELNK